jgi:hypothetical protein
MNNCAVYLTAGSCHTIPQESVPMILMRKQFLYLNFISAAEAKVDAIERIPAIVCAQCETVAC